MTCLFPHFVTSLFLGNKEEVHDLMKSSSKQEQPQMEKNDK